MTGRSKVWLVVAVLFTLVNLGGAVVAAVWREPLHAALHVVLLVLGAYAVRRLVPTGIGRRDAHPDTATMSAAAFADQLARLEQSVDGVAVEVERIGEGQRFVTRALVDQGDARALDRAAPDASRSPGAWGG